jgi:uncharacterized protein YcaQ
MKISASAARRLAIRCQGLDGQWRLSDGKEGIAEVIERLGYVQIDTIAVVQRAHHHTLWSRFPAYAPQMLDELLAQDRRVFEGWNCAHVAAYLPICDYRYYRAMMRAYAKSPRARRWLDENGELARDVLERIRKEGPLASADFAAPPEFVRGTWWNWKPSKRALEVLFSTGELMVARRRGFQRIYDLTERVLPAGTDTTAPDEAELGHFVVRRALAGLGLASLKALRPLCRRCKDLPGALERLVDSGEVVRVQVKGMEGEAYALARTLDEEMGQLGRSRRLHILSPFDNLTRREQMSALFGFEYRLECYVPAAERRYGYFCLPILWGERFVGRLDSKADRKKRSFIVRRLTFEPDTIGYDRLLPTLAKKLWSFAAFNACDRISLEQVVPEEAGTALRRALDGRGPEQAI